MANKTRPKQTLTPAERKTYSALTTFYMKHKRPPRVEEISRRIRKSHSYTARLLNQVVDKGHANKDESRYMSITPIL